MKKIKQILNKYWQKDSSPYPLAIFRILLFSYTIIYIYWLVGWRTIVDYHDLSQILWYPQSFYQLFDFKKIPRSIISTFFNFLWLPLFLAAIGVMTKWTTKIAAIAVAFYFASFINLLKLMAVDAPLVMSLLIISFSSCGDRLSIDYCFKKNSKKLLQNKNYSWPLQFNANFIALSYFLAGLAKLKMSGLYWMYSDNLMFIFLTLDRPLGLYFANNFSYLGPTLSSLTIVMELAWSLIIFRPHWVKYLIFPSLAMHFSSYFFLGIIFRSFVFLHIVFLPWKIIFKRFISMKPLMTYSSKYKYQGIFISSLFLLFTLFHFNEFKSDIKKPFWWPFTSYYMFAHPTLKKDQPYSRIELFLVTSDKKEIQFPFCLSQPLSPKHLRELVLRLVKQEKVFQIEQLAFHLLKKNKDQCFLASQAETLHLIELTWNRPNLKNFSLNNPDHKKLIKKINL